MRPFWASLRGLALAIAVCGHMAMAQSEPPGGSNSPVSGTTGTFSGPVSASSFTTLGISTARQFVATADAGTEAWTQPVGSTMNWGDTARNVKDLGTGIVQFTGDYWFSGNNAVLAGGSLNVNDTAYILNSGAGFGGAVGVNDAQGVCVGNGTGTDCDGPVAGSTYTANGASGDTFVSASGGFVRDAKAYAGVPTAADCDAAGELGRSALDTTNTRNYRCYGAAGWAAPASALSTAPTVAACTTPGVTFHDGPTFFQFDVGNTCTTVQTATVTLPAKTNGWICTCVSVGAATTRVIEQSGGTTTTCVLTNYSRTLGTAADWADGADVRCGAVGG